MEERPTLNNFVRTRLIGKVLDDCLANYCFQNTSVCRTH